MDKSQTSYGRQRALSLEREHLLIWGTCWNLGVDSLLLMMSSRLFSQTYYNTASRATEDITHYTLHCRKVETDLHVHLLAFFYESIRSLCVIIFKHAFDRRAYYTVNAEWVCLAGWRLDLNMKYVCFVIQSSAFSWPFDTVEILTLLFLLQENISPHFKQCLLCGDNWQEMEFSCWIMKRSKLRMSAREQFI